MSTEVKPARFQSICSRCWDPIVPGDPILYIAEEFRSVHADCKPRPMPVLSDPAMDRDVQRVVAHLELNQQQLTKFEVALLTYYRRHGTLTQRQLDIQLSRMSSRRAMEGRLMS